MWSESERLDQGEFHQLVLRTFGLTAELLDRHNAQVSPAAKFGSLGSRNDFKQDRAGMRAGSTYSGGLGLTLEDGLMTCSIPAEIRYTDEHLVPSDIAIAQLRRLLTNIGKQVEAGETPIALSTRTKSTEIGSTSAVLKSASEFSFRDLRPAHVARVG